MTMVSTNSGSIASVVDISGKSDGSGQSLTAALLPSPRLGLLARACSAWKRLAMVSSGSTRAFPRIWRRRSLAAASKMSFGRANAFRALLASALPIPSSFRVGKFAGGSSQTRLLHPRRLPIACPD